MRHTANNIFIRLNKAGFKRDFVRKAILPEWWDDNCSTEQDLITELEVRVSRFLGCSIGKVRDPGFSLSVAPCGGAKLRRVKDIDRDRLGPAIHAALRIGAAVVRSLRHPVEPVSDLPASGKHWRTEIQQGSKPIHLQDVVENLWMRGIPVVPLETLPTPSFQGLTCVIEGRPVIMLGHKHDEPGRVAFVIAHEAGHIAAGDCNAYEPIVDEDESIIDESPMELAADLYAMEVLVGSDSVPQLQDADYLGIARQAAMLSRTQGIDASAMIYAWGRHTGNYVAVTMALKALYQAKGARQLLRDCFDRYVDIDGAAESDQLLMRAIFGGARDDASVI